MISFICNTKIEYLVQLHSPLGIKSGKLILKKKEDKVSGMLIILNLECALYDLIVSETNLEFCCLIKTIIGDINCEVHLTDKCGKLYGMVQTNKGCMAITGQKIMS